MFQDNITIIYKTLYFNYLQLMNSYGKCKDNLIFPKQSSVIFRIIKPEGFLFRNKFQQRNQDWLPFFCCI